MFLQVMNTEEKEKFIELIYKVANIDGEYAEEEKEIVASYMKELDINVIPNTTDIKELISYFATKSETLKRIVIFEIIGLIKSDDKIEKNEKLILDDMESSFNISADVMKQIGESVSKLQEVYDQIYDVLFE